MSSARLRLERWALTGGGGLLVVVLVAPLVALFVKTSPDTFLRSLGQPQVWSALKLSAVTTLSSLFVVVILGTPLAWTLVQTRTRMGRAIETVLLLPMVIPPAVSGLTLLLAFGRRGLFTRALGLDSTVAFTAVAVVVAQVFVSAPYYVQAATSAFRRLDEGVLLVARTLGAGPLRLFTRIAIPLSASSLFSGAAVSWARALGEFGATLLFAGNLEGVTQTLPLAIYTAAEADLGVAQALSLVLVSVAWVMLLLVRRSTGRGESTARGESGSIDRGSTLAPNLERRG